MPEHPSIQQLLIEATSNYHAGDYRQAIFLWQKVLVSEPANQRAKEGIRMASLLLDEAQAASEMAQQGAGSPAGASETPESIAKVRDGIQKVRECLASSRHLEAMEICQSLLAMAPRSAAVHEIVEEAREAYEAQPFISEHLEIARQLFVQERLDETAAELHKVFFLNPNHAEARKIEAKILALRQKRSPVPPVPAATGQKEPSSPEKSPTPEADLSAQTQRFAAPPDFGDTLDLSQESAPADPAASAAPAGGPGAPVSAGSTPGVGDPGPVLNESWEAELAQLDLGTSPPASSAPAKPEPAKPEETPAETLELMDLSENPEALRPSPESAEAEAPSEIPPRGTRHATDLDLSPIEEEQLLEAQMTSAPGSMVPLKPSRGAAKRRSGASAMRFALPLVGILIGGGAAWWYLGSRLGSSGGGGTPSPPPQVRAPQNSGAPGASGGRGGGANLGLSSSGSRGSGNTAAAGVTVPGVSAPIPPAAPSLTPEAVRQEIVRLSEEGRSLAERGKYQEAVRSFSKVLDLDPSNMEAKDQMDLAASRILEQKRLEEDLQTAKEFFMEKDYESALRKFYRLPKDRNLGDLDLFIRNAWYNWAVNSMRGGNCEESLQRLQEVLTADPNDKEAVKQQEVAEHYRGRPKDRVFYAYVDRLTYRTLNQK
jgi:tetratricopeptide (TPR) repeat protein